MVRFLRDVAVCLVLLGVSGLVVDRIASTALGNVVQCNPPYCTGLPGTVCATDVRCLCGDGAHLCAR